MYKKGFGGLNNLKKENVPLCRWDKQWYTRKLSALPEEMRVHSFPRRMAGVPTLWDLKKPQKRYDPSPPELFQDELQPGTFFVADLRRTQQLMIEKTKRYPGCTCLTC